MRAINCCNGCVAPKRHPACHDHCEEYQKEKAEYEERKAVADREKRISYGLYQQRATALAKNMKGRKQRGFQIKGKSNNG